MTNWKAREALDARFRRFCCKSSNFEEAKSVSSVGDSAKSFDLSGSSGMESQPCVG
jgi:hypothetical protein